METYEAALKILALPDDHHVSYDILYDVGHPVPTGGQSVSAREAKGKAVEVLVKEFNRIDDRLRDLEGQMTWGGGNP